MSQGQQGQVESLTEQGSKDQSQLEQLSDQLGKVELQMKGQEKTIGDMVQARVASLEAELKSKVFELRNSIEKAAARSTAAASKKIEESMGSLESGLQSLRDQDQTLEQSIASLNERHHDDTGRIVEEVTELRMHVEVVANKDSCVTSRCLSCYDRRSQESTLNEVTGVDGKPYRQGRPTATVEGGRIGTDSNIAAKLPTLAADPQGRIRRAHKPMTKASLNGGAGAPLHQVNVASAMRVEDAGSLRQMKRIQSSPGISRTQPASSSMTVPAYSGAAPDVQIAAKDRSQPGVDVSIKMIPPAVQTQQQQPQ